MTAGRAIARIDLRRIGIFDLPYIFGNFAPQFPEKQSRNRGRWRILCSFINAGPRSDRQDDEAQNKYHSC